MAVRMVSLSFGSSLTFNHVKSTLDIVLASSNVYYQSQIIALSTIMNSTRVHECEGRVNARKFQSSVSFITLLIQRTQLDSLAYMPNFPRFPQPSPKLVMPNMVQGRLGLLGSWHRRGPPLSPAHESIFPRRYPAQNMLSVILQSSQTVRHASEDTMGICN